MTHLEHYYDVPIQWGVRLFSYFFLKFFYFNEKDYFQTSYHELIMKQSLLQDKTKLNLKVKELITMIKDLRVKTSEDLRLIQLFK